MRGVSSTGQRVLIIGASGGVGTYAVQLAKALGADVTGVCSTAKIDLVRSLGADRVIDYTHDDFADGTERYDLILDIGGSSSLSRLRRALSPKGTLVIVGGEGGGNTDGNGPPTPGRRTLAVRATTAHHARSERALRRSGTTHRVHRGRYRHAEHRPHLPTRSSRRRDAASGQRRLIELDAEVRIGSSTAAPATRTWSRTSTAT